MHWLKKMNWDVALIGVAIFALIILAMATPPSSPPPVNTQPAQLSLLDRRADRPHLSRAYVRPAPTKKAAPKPTPKPEVKKSPVVTKPQTPQKPTSANVTLACIRHHESRGDYGVVSEVRSGVTYQGAYQLSSRYTAVWATRYGYKAWSSKPAHTWPASVQDAVALGLGKDSNWHSWSDFTSYSCPGF